MCHMQHVFHHAHQNNLVKNTETETDIPLTTRDMKNTWQELSMEQIGICSDRESTLWFSAHLGSTFYACA